MLPDIHPFISPMKIGMPSPMAVPSDDSNGLAADHSCLVMSEEEKAYDDVHKQGKHIIMIPCKRHNFNLMLLFGCCAATRSQLTSLKCTTCSCQLFLVNSDNIRFHPVLGVIICKVSSDIFSLFSLLHFA